MASGLVLPVSSYCISRAKIYENLGVFPCLQGDEQPIHYYKWYYHFTKNEKLLPALTDVLPPSQVTSDGLRRYA